MNKIFEFINKNKQKDYNINLLSIEKSIELLDLLKQNNIEIYWFDGFKLLEDWKYQIDQVFSRDYSSFSQEEAYNLSKEYFLKSNEKHIYYEISFNEKYPQY